MTHWVYSLNTEYSRPGYAWCCWLMFVFKTSAAHGSKFSIINITLFTWEHSGDWTWAVHSHPAYVHIPSMTAVSLFCFLYFHYPAKGLPDGSAGKESTCNAGDPGLIPGSGRSPGEGIGYPVQYSWVSLVAQLVKNPPAMWETWVWSLGWEDPLEKGKVTHSSILAWRIPWTV